MNSVYLGIAPRKQWDSNFGYCGEVSFISAGLKYGQYISQFDARALASPSISQALPKSQLLLGPQNRNNDQVAARAMHLTFEEFDYAREISTRAFLAWVRQRIISGFPVMIGVYMNQSVFGNGSDNDDEYDHIVPVIGIESPHLLTEQGYFDDDVIVFSDNGEYTSDSASPSYIFRYTFSEFQKTRTEANSPTSGIYSLAKCIHRTKNYAIALTGIATDGFTLSAQVYTNVNEEVPPIVDGSNSRPKSMAITLTVTLKGLSVGTRYMLYRYNHMSAVPDKAFNANAGKATRIWDILADTTSLSIAETIPS